jgi:hypothetical protein
VISGRLERRPVLSVNYIVDNYPRTTRTSRCFNRGVAETKYIAHSRFDTGDRPKQVLTCVREHQHLRLSTPPPKYFFPILPVFNKLERRSCPVVLASWLRSDSWNRPLGSRTLFGRKQSGSDTNAKEHVQMKACWIGILVTGALVISAFGQNSVACKRIRSTACW